MREIALFVEDFAHRQFLLALLHRFGAEFEVDLKLEWRNARRGHGRVIYELKQFLRDLQLGRDELPDLIVVATDSNCLGLTGRLKQISEITEKIAVRTVCAVPDPHIERWFLADSAAFKRVFGRGCDAPDQKCERTRYKKMLIDSIRNSGIVPNLGGIEFAEDIVNAMNLDRVGSSDHSLGRLIQELRSIFKEWRNKI